MSTATKIDLVEGLVEAGLKQVEVTSFVSPKWVPQLADAAHVCEGIMREGGVKYPVLVPNLKASIRNCCASHVASCNHHKLRLHMLRTTPAGFPPGT